MHNKKGVAIHGSVRWMANVQSGGETFPVIGIETVMPTSKSISACHILHFVQYQTWTCEYFVPKMYMYSGWMPRLTEGSVIFRVPGGWPFLCDT